MKTVLFFHHCGIIGGAGISGLNFLNCLPRDNKIIVYCESALSDQMLRLFESSNIDVIEGFDSPASYNYCVGAELPLISPQSIKNIIDVIVDSRKVRKVIKQVNPDVVIVNSLTLFWIGKIAKE